MKRIYIIISMLSFMFASCSGFLEEYSQDTAYVRGYEDLDELLLGSVYMPTNAPEHMGYTYGTDGWYYPYIHLMTDEVKKISEVLVAELYGMRENVISVIIHGSNKWGLMR